MSEKPEIITTPNINELESSGTTVKKISEAGYDQDFLYAYALLEEHVQSGNATTRELAKALEDLTKTIRAFGHSEDPVR